MYEKYVKLREEKGVKDSEVARETGIARSMFSEWKNGKYEPKKQRLEKLARYFGVDLIGPGSGRVVNCNPDALSSRFNRAVKYSGIENRFTFHALRHYYVSISHALKISDAYTMKMGGWKTDNVMKRNYRAALSDVENREQKRLNKHFEQIAHEIAHERRFG